MRSVSVGVWVGVGSRDETPALCGASHFLEHLLFKGTRRRSALDISAEIEAVGGETNAFTSKEYTCYYARVLDADLPLVVDVLGDLITSSLIAAADVTTRYTTCWPTRSTAITRWAGWCRVPRRRWGRCGGSRSTGSTGAGTRRRT